MCARLKCAKIYAARIRASEREGCKQTEPSARRARGFCFSSVAPNLWPTGDVLRAKAARVNYVIICIASAIPLKIHTAIVPIYICICTREGSGVFLSLFWMCTVYVRATRKGRYVAVPRVTNSWVIAGGGLICTCPIAHLLSAWIMNSYATVKAQHMLWLCATLD